MKTVIALLIALQMHSAQANDMNGIEACENVGVMGVLNKDNMPYWTANENTGDNEACYTALTESLINRKGSAVKIKISNSTIQIFNNDNDFNQFIAENDPQYGEFKVDFASMTNNSVIPVVRPIQVNFELQ